MPKYVIEREVPGIGTKTAEELRVGAQESNAVVSELGPDDLKWITSYITDDKIYCVFIAASEEIVREHARCLDLPADRVSRVVTNTDPATAE
jgi:hypothetical protein